MSRDEPEFLPPDPADLPEPGAPVAGPATPPFEPPPPPGTPLPAAQPSAHDTGSRKGVAWKVSLLVAIPLLVIAILALAVVGARHVASSLKPRVPVAGPGSPTPTAPSKPPATTDPPKPTPSPSATPTKPVVAGWQPVVHAKRGVAYDVPRGWEVNPADTIVGFENVGTANRTLAMSGSAEYASGYCTDDGSGLWRAVTGVAAGPKTGDLRAQTTSLAESWGNVYDEPTKHTHAVSDAGPIRPVHVKGARAYHVRVGITVTGGDACTPHRARVDVVTVRGAHSNGVFVIAADQGASADADRATIDKIVSTVRVYKP